MSQNQNSNMVYAQNKNNYSDDFRIFYCTGFNEGTIKEDPRDYLREIPIYYRLLREFLSNGYQEDYIPTDIKNFEAIFLFSISRMFTFV